MSQSMPTTLLNAILMKVAAKEIDLPKLVTDLKAIEAQKLNQPLEKFIKEGRLQDVKQYKHDTPSPHFNAMIYVREALGPVGWALWLKQNGLPEDS